MSSRLTDEREQRRGLILGLTLAEVLLLLLFLLLLVLSSQIKIWQDRYELANQGLQELKPLQESLMVGGAIYADSVEHLVLRFKELQSAERDIASLKAENIDLTKRSELVQSLGFVSAEKLQGVVDAVKHAAAIQPNDPPALLNRALDVMDRLGPSTKPDQVKPLSEMLKVAELEHKLSDLEADRENVRRERDNLMHGPGNGLTYPSCWTTTAGQTEYIFDVTLADNGVQVRNATPARAKDRAWSLVGSFARETMINESMFIGATKKLFDWSKGQNCRFYTIVRDGTGESKDRYKHLQEMVQQNFYPLYLSPQRKKFGGITGVPSVSSEETGPLGNSPVH